MTSKTHDDDDHDDNKAIKRKKKQILPLVKLFNFRFTFIQSIQKLRFLCFELFRFFTMNE